MFSISFYKLAIISPCRRACLFIWKESEFPLPKDALCEVWLKLALYFWSRNPYIFIVFIIFLLSPLEKGRGPFFVKIWIPSTQGCCTVEIGPLVLKRGFLNILNIILSTLHLNLNLLHSRMFCVKLGWNWPCCSELEYLKN